MCYNCEGEIDLDVIVCPFCAADLREEKPEQQRVHYNPNQSMKNLKAQESLYPSQAAPVQPIPKLAEEEEVPEEALLAQPEETKRIIGPTVLITLGSQLLLFGLFMVLFSHKGVVILKWDARLWFFYILASVPLLLFGYRALSKLE